MSTRFYDRSRARRSLLDTIAYRVASQLTTVLGYIVLVRAMQKQDFGVLNLLYSVVGLVGTAASLGLEQTLRRYQPEYLKTGNAKGAGWLVQKIVRWRWVSNCVVLALILLVWNWIAPYFDLGPYRSDFAFFCILIVLYFQTQLLQLTMAAHMLHRYSVGSVALLSFSKLAGYSLLALGGALNLRNAILIDTAATIVVYAFLRTAYARQCAASARAQDYRPSVDEKKRLLRYALFNNFNDAGTFFLESRIDNFFIAAFSNAVAVGIYSFYFRLSEMAVNMLPSRLFDNIIQPMFFAIQPAEADARVPQYFTFLLNVNLLVLWPLLAFTIVYHANIVAVAFGGKYVEQSWLMCVIMGFATVNSFATPASLVAQFEERAHIQLLSKVFALYNIAALLIMVPLWGLYGAAFAIGTAQVFKNAFIWWHVRHRAKWLNARASILASLGIWGLAIVVCEGLKLASNGNSLAQLAYGSVAFSAFAVLHVRGPILCNSDREILARLFPGREMRLLRVLGLLSPALGSTGAR